ncbi:MAG TPA: IS110 family transposase [Aquirhabdus sp.]
MNYIGMDIHKKNTYAVVKDELGNKLAEDEMASSKEALARFLAPFQPSESSIVIESTYITEYIYTLLEEMHYAITVANPHKLKAIAFAKVKNDKVDASMLADLLRANLIGKSYMPSLAIRQLREITRMRSMLVRHGTQIINALRAHLVRKGIKLPNRKLCKNAIVFLQKQCKGDIVVQNSLAVLQTVQRQLAKVDTQLHAHAKKSKDAKLLMTIPGIGPIRAMTLLAEIGDINRFPKAEPLCSHAGLVPTIRQSANTMHVGHCSAQANKQLKNVFVQAALTAKRMKRGNAIQTHYCNLVEKKGKQKAICAAARKMCCIVYAVLHKKEKFSFSYSSP